MAIRAVPVVDWTVRFEKLDADQSALDAAALDELGQAAWFIGRDDVSARAWERAHLRYLDDGDAADAVRCAFWLGFTLAEHGETVKAGAWMARVAELGARTAPDATTGSYAALARAQGAFASGDGPAAVGLFRLAAQLAGDASEADVEALAAMGLGRALMGTGRIEEAMACMDRVMLLIGTGHVTDRAAGPAYCAVIASLLARGDIERVRVWTRDLGDWCDAQRGLEPFRGECTLHRAAVMQLGGEWASARDAVDRVCGTETRPDTLGNAWYLLGELHRVSGRSAPARDAYRRAAAVGRDVQPGLALLHRDAGELDTAWLGLLRAGATTMAPAARVPRSWPPACRSRAIGDGSATPGWRPSSSAPARTPSTPCTCARCPPARMRRSRPPRAGTSTRSACCARCRPPGDASMRRIAAR